MNDFIDVRHGTFLKAINEIIGRGEQHVYNCDLCTAHGFLCEYCTDKQVIFPWQSRVSAFGMASNGGIGAKSSIWLNISGFHRLFVVRSAVLVRTVAAGKINVENAKGWRSWRRTKLAEEEPMKGCPGPQSEANFFFLNFSVDFY